MAEKISGLIALGKLAMLLCVFVPATTYVIRRAMRRRLHGGYAGFDIVALLVVVTTLGAMLYIVVDAQQLYPRCGMHNENAEPLCFVDRYDTTGPVVAVSRDEAAARMRADLLADVARCIIVPSVLGIAAFIVLARLPAGVGVVAGGGGVVEKGESDANRRVLAADTVRAEKRMWGEEHTMSLQSIEKFLKKNNIVNVHASNILGSVY